MKKYPKIQTVFLRDPNTNFKTVVEGEFALPEFEYLKDTTWEFTEKIDGTNTRIGYHKGVLTFDGKSDNSMLSSQLFNTLNHTFLSKLDKLADMFKDGEVCLYGEGYGKGIQKNGYKYRENQNFVLFDVMVGTWWLQFEDVMDVAYRLGIEVAPVIGEGNLYDMVELVKNGFKSTYGDFTAEGIVARPKVQIFNRRGERIITKLKHKDFTNLQSSI